MAMLPVRIETERLLLRPWQLSDVDDVFGYASDKDWARFLPVPQPYRRQHAEEFIASQLLLDKDKHQSWAIVLDEAVIGGINIWFDHDNRFGNLGYSIAAEHWRKGLATEASVAVVGAAFEADPKLNRIQAWADVRNTASLRVMEKSGMKREGLMRKHRLVRDEAVDDVYYAILREEWEG